MMKVCRGGGRVGGKVDRSGRMELLLVVCLERESGLPVSLVISCISMLIWLDRLPRPLFMRSMIIGTVLGGITSALQVVQAKVGKLREEEARRAKVEEEEQASVDRQIQEGESLTYRSDEGRSPWSGVRSLTPGLRREER